MYTMSQIRNRVNTLKRKYATELKILKVFPIAEEFSLDWACMAADRLPLPGSGDFIRHLASWGFRFHTYTNLHQYLEGCREQGDIPDALGILSSLFPRCPGRSWLTSYPTTSLPGNTRAGLPPRAMKSSVPPAWSWPPCAASPRRALATGPPWASLPPRGPSSTTTTGPPAAGSSASPRSSPRPGTPALQPCSSKSPHPSPVEGQDGCEKVPFRFGWSGSDTCRGRPMCLPWDHTRNHLNGNAACEKAPHPFLVQPGDIIL